MFSHLLGNGLIKAYLMKAIEENRLSQALLFVGPLGVGKSLFARALAKQLLGKEASLDLHVYAPDGKSGLYAIDRLRELIEQERKASFEGKGKVFILEDVECMQPASANVLLKTLEEPTPDTTFILLTSNPQEILPTILSRSTLLRFQPLLEGEVASLLHAKGYPVRLAKLAGGSIGRAFELAEHPEWEEDQKILFHLLEKFPSYPELFLQLAQLEEKILKEKDPVQLNRKVEYLFSSILMWHRDQHFRQLGGKEALLFFPDAPKRDPYRSLKEVEKGIEMARLAYQRNIKLSSCLIQIFSATSPTSPVSS